jgi:hypothetical protein
VHFTFVFNSHESIDLAYGMVFIPGPVWVAGEDWLLNLSPDGPRYRTGSVRRLLAKEDIITRLHAGTRDSIIVVHPSGHGIDEDLRTLETDLRQEGFNVRTFFFKADSALFEG